MNNDPSETSVSVGVLYSLSSVWDLDLTAIRLVHIQALLSAYKDDEVEILLQDVSVYHSIGR